MDVNRLQVQGKLVVRSLSGLVQLLKLLQRRQLGLGLARQPVLQSELLDVCWDSDCLRLASVADLLDLHELGVLLSQMLLAGRSLRDIEDRRIQFQLVDVDTIRPSRLGPDRPLAPGVAVSPLPAFDRVVARRRMEEGRSDLGFLVLDLGVLHELRGDAES